MHTSIYIMYNIYIYVLLLFSSKVIEHIIFGFDLDSDVF